MHELKEIGVKDSKLVEPKNREKLYKAILNIIEDYKVIIIPPKEIDEAVLSKENNLNKLEAQKAAEIIQYLKPNKVIMDCPSTNIKAYTEYLKSLITIKPELVLEHKADLNNVEVGAASIISKYIREEEIKKLKEKIKEDFGSGYPSDPYTQEFIKKNFKKHADIMRKSWQTYKNLINGEKQNKLNNY